MRQLIDGQIVSYFIYFVGSISISTGIGLWALSLKKYIRISGMGCFLFGFSLTPYFIGCFMLIMSFFPVKFPRIAYLAPVYILAFLLATLKREVWLPYIKVYKLKIGCPSFYKQELFVMWCCCLFLILIYPVLPINTLYKIYGVSIIEDLLRGVILLSIVLLILYIFWKERKTMIVSVGNGDRKGKDQYILTWHFEVEKEGIKEYEKRNNLELNSKILVNGYVTLKVLFPIAMMSAYIILVQYFWNFLSSWNGGNTGIREIVFSVLIGSMTLLLLSMFMLLYGAEKKDKTQVLYQAIRAFIVIISSYTIFNLLRQACISSYSPVIGADANEYLSAALRYVYDLKFSSVTLFDGTPDGSLMPIMHHPAWIMYLGNALMYTPTVGMGNTVDFAARLAFQMTYLYLFAAVAACATAYINNKSAIMLSTVLPLAFNLFSYIYTASSKDAFRLIPLMLLPVVLLGVEKEFQENPQDYRGIFIALFVGCFVMMGHPINALTAVTIVIAFFIYLLSKKRLFCKQTISLYVTTAIGALVGSFQMGWALLKTGSLMGTGYDVATILKGTAYLSNFLEYTESRLQGTETYWERLFLILKRDGGVLSIPAIAGSIVILVTGIGIFLKKKKGISEYGFLAIIVFCNSLLLTDIVQWSDISLSKWCVMNVRYTFQIYIFWGIFMAASISKIIDNVFRLAFKKRLMTIIILSIYVSIPSAAVWFRMPQYEPVDRYKSTNSIVDEYVQANIVSSEYPESRILIDNFYANYYLNDTALTFLSERAASIRKAVTLEELDQAMEAEKIDVIMLTASLRDVYWKETPLEEYVHNLDYVVPIDEEGGSWIYVRKKYAKSAENK